MARTVRGEATVRLACAAADLWSYVAYTDHIDRAAGLPPARFVHRRRLDGGEQHQGEYRLFGVRIARWAEHPFEWVQPDGFSILREYDYGPLLRFRGWTELRPVGAETDLTVGVEFEPRWLLVAPLFRFVLVPWSLRAVCSQYRDVARFICGQAEAAQPELVRRRTPASSPRLAACMEQLLTHALPDDVTSRLQRLLTDAADEEVLGLRPLELAQTWQTDPATTVETFLWATIAGLVHLQWELLCPVCRGVKASGDRLRDVAVTGFCSSCNAHVVATADEGLEARFYPSPAIRPVHPVTYCVGSPAQTLHRIAQAELAPGDARTWRLDLPAGLYRVHSAQSRTMAEIVVADDALLATARLEIGGDAILPAQQRILPGEVTIDVHNRTAHQVTVGLDDERWREAALTPARLLLTPAFRSLFSTEALAPGVELAIGRVGLLFTDLAGSTALYERVGDAEAFRLVADHFAILRESIETHDGAVVKTIGDAVMAAFPDGTAALTAALALQRSIRTLPTRGVADARRLVKAGVHEGPCFAVTLNDRLDYFGTSVNITARAQHEAHGGEVVATTAVRDSCPELFSALPSEPFEVRLRGISAPVTLFRIDCATANGEADG